jgi:hypothetical protein
MPLLALKFVLTPFLIGGASLAARRWGPATAGWLVGLPLTSGPVAAALAVQAVSLRLLRAAPEPGEVLA